MVQQKKDIPRHVGLILDGNRRWARENGLPTLEGHKAGADNLHTIATYAFETGVKYVSAFIFSTENWQRSSEEVDYLMNLTALVFKKYIAQFKEKKIRIHWLGTRDKLSSKLQKTIDKALRETKDFDDGHLCLCFNYGGRLEIIDAIKGMVSEGIDMAKIDEQKFTDYLYEPSVPDVDLMIRTSGEQRISNFQLWRSAYAELHFVNKHWPAFTKDDLDKALDEYGSRHRRFGV